MVKSTPRAPSSGNPAEPEEGQATLLVSEFPPVPFYYRLASTGELLPPPIPTEALARGTSRASAQAARARAESERLRSGDEDETDAILGGVPAAEDEDDGDVVAVFGEIVEDPLLMEPLDRCEDPRVVRDEVKRLNQDVVKGFVKLVQDLVHRPIENKKTRDDLSHNVFLMLQETNKFREHQARHNLIELLEDQLKERQALLGRLRDEMKHVDNILGK